MKLNQLPVEVLMNVISYLPKHGEVSLVEKLFYEIACKVNDSTICLRIDRPFLERFLSDDVTSSRSQWYEGIRKSNRNISKVQIIGENKPFENGNERPIISLLEKFSSTIKCLQMKCVVINVSAFMEILSLVPNAEELDFDEVCFYAEDQPSKKRRANDELNLSKLKSLSVIGCKEEFLQIFDRLPAGVLKDLHVSGRWSTFTTILSRQFNIKTLNLKFNDHHIQGATEMFSKLQLECLELNSLRINSASVVEMLSTQNELKSLNLSYVHDVDEQVVNAINQKGLERLTMQVVRMSVSSFVQIRRLKKLQEFNLRCYAVDNRAVQTLAESDNTSITKLILGSRNPMSVDLIVALAQSAPHLKSFEVTNQATLDSIGLEAMLRRFNYVEVLKFIISKEPVDDAGDYFNPKLRELEIFDEGELSYSGEMWQTKFISSYPNLEKLMLRLFNISFDIRQILDGFPKLESLIIRGKSTEPVINYDDLDRLCKHKGNLKFVSWNYSEQNALTDELAKKLQASFGLIWVDRDKEIVHVAVDRHTMSCERAAYWHY